MPTSASPCIDKSIYVKFLFHTSFSGLDGAGGIGAGAVSRIML